MTKLSFNVDVTHEITLGISNRIYEQKGFVSQEHVGYRSVATTLNRCNFYETMSTRDIRFHKNRFPNRSD